jgi:hypothetical protein
MQKMKNGYKQLGLDELCEKLNNKKAGGASNGPMSLEHKKDFVSHQAFVKQVSKDANLAHAFQQKEIKKRDVQSTKWQKGGKEGCKNKLKHCYF